MSTRPLTGRRILIPRTVSQAGPLVDRLESVGARVDIVPLIRIAPVDDLSSLERKLVRLEKFRWLVFTSVNAVRVFQQACQAAAIQTEDMDGCKIAAVGPATRIALESYGMSVDLCPEAGHAEHLVQPLLDGTKQGDLILFPCGNLAAHKRWVAQLRDAGRIVELEVVYRTLPQVWTEAERSRFRQRVNESVDAVVLTSPSITNQFVALLGYQEAVQCSEQLAVVSIGRVTAERARYYRLRVAAVPRRPTPLDLVHCLIKHFQEDENELSD